MNYSDAKKVLLELIKAKLDVVICSKPRSGKTTLVREVAPDAPIVHSSELKDEHLGFLRSLATTNEIVIIENCTMQSAEFLAPIISTRSILGSIAKSQFLITADERVTIDTVARVWLERAEINEYLEWANTHNIHPAVIEALNADSDFYTRYDSVSFQSISKLLHSRPSQAQIAWCIEAILGRADHDFLEALIGGKQTATIATHEKAEAYERELIDAVKIKPNKENEAKFLRYLSTVSTDSALKLVGGLLKTAKAHTVVLEALKGKRLQERIDELITQD